MDAPSQNKMSFYPAVGDTDSKATISIEELVEKIRRPSVGIITTISKARTALAEGRDGDYDEIKTTLPAVTFSGTFKTRKAENLKTHTGLVGIDFDEMAPEALAEARGKLVSDPHCVFLYVSPSGAGLKGAVRIDSLPANAGEHKTAFSAVRNYMEQTHGLIVDPKCSDVSRLAFLSHDPDCHHNPEPGPLVVDDWRDMTEEEKEVERLHGLLEQTRLTSIKTPPPPAPLILSTDDGKILGEAGNIVTLEGLMKTGKSGVLSAIIAATVAPRENGGDFLGFTAPHREGYILHFDCEQSPRSHFRLIETACKKRAGLAEIPPELLSFSFLGLTIEDRWPACELAARSLAGPIRLVIFDGGADFLKILNDEETSREMVALMHRFAVEQSCLVLIVIHENPNGEGGKTRGHFGSELWRKVQSALGVAKGEDGISSIHGKYLRDGDWPKSEAQHFRYCTEAGMHITADDPTEDRRASKTAAKEAAKREGQAALAKKIMSAPVMTHSALEAAVMKAEHIKDRAARDRIKNLVEVGFISKREDGHYELPK